jgi:hypothetical protein
MYGLQVGEVVPAFKGRPRKFVRSCRDEGRFGLFKRGRGGDTEAIIQDAGCRVKVMVMAGISGHS